MTPVADRLGWVLLHFLWQGTAIAIACAIALRWLGRAPARTRYMAACITLLAFVLVPSMTWAVLATPRPVANAEPPRRVVIRMELQPGMEPVMPEVGPRDPRPSADTSLLSSAREALVMVWLAGVTLLLIRFIGGAWRVRQVYRAAARFPDSQWTIVAQRIADRFGIRRAVRVVDADFVDTPTLLGWVAPIVVLPADAISRLTAAQVEAILAHELAHVHRHDYLVNMLQAACEAALCHHPAAWWISRRIRAEREHCCDDLAIAVCSDRVGYAEALTELETSRTAQPRLALAVTGGSLLTRIRHVLAPAPQGRRHAAVGAIGALLAVCGAAVGATEYQASKGTLGGIKIAEVERVVMIRAVHRHAEGPPQATRAIAMPFDVASVKSNTTADDGTRLFQALPGGRVNIVNYPLREIIRSAYQIQPYQLIGGPDWLSDARFDIAASAPDDPAPPQLLVMLRGLLADRFGLALHPETREMPVYLLVRARADGQLGDRLRPAAVDCAVRAAEARASRTPGPAAAFDPSCGFRVGIGSMAGGGVDMETIARRLAPVAGRPVVDRTMLTGRFDLDLAFAPDALAPGDTPPILTAVQEQLGLKLQPDRRPVDVLVIDKVQRPTAN